MTAIQQPVVEETAVQRNPAANAAANTARNFATRPMTGQEYIASLQDGREIYLHLPGGVADSKLTNAYFDARLATISTARNWRTVLKLLEMTQA